MKIKSSIRVYGLMLMMAMAMFFATPVKAQASAKSTYQKAVSYYKNGKYKKAQKQFKKLKGTANESCVKNMSSKMKKTYLKVVKKYVKQTDAYGVHLLYGYYLTDIDKDGKAELIIKYGSCEADMRAYVYQYKNGKAKKLGKTRAGHINFYYDPRGNGMTVAEQAMGYEEIYTLKIKNGKLKLTSWTNQLRQITPHDMATGADGYMNLPYALDGHATFSSSGTTFDYSPLK